MEKGTYKNINNVTARTNLDETYLKIVEDRPKQGEMVGALSSAVPIGLAGKPVQISIKPVILQNPQMQLFNSFTNYSVCPYCKYSGAMEIRYKSSSKQKTCCFLMILTGCCLCCWIPFVVKDCSDQVYACGSCKELLKTLPSNRVD